MVSYVRRYLFLVKGEITFNIISKPSMKRSPQQLMQRLQRVKQLLKMDDMILHLQALPSLSTELRNPVLVHSKDFLAQHHLLELDLCLFWCLKEQMDI
eukprot:g25441.t1